MEVAVGRKVTVSELKQEIAEGYQELARLMKLPDPGPNFTIGVMSSLRAVADLERELGGLGITVPKAVEFEIDWSLSENRGGFSRSWVGAVPCRILPLLGSLLAELRRREETFSGDEVTAGMLAELQARFSTGK